MTPVLFSYMKLTAAQEIALHAAVKGKVVHDLGAGCLGPAHRLVELGAKHVVAVDRVYQSRHENYLNGCGPWKSGSPKISLKAQSFEEFARTNKRVLRTVLVSWPEANHFIFGAESDLFLATLVALAVNVIYIGSNFDGTACGGPLLFNELRRRRVKQHVPDKKNSLIVYGKALRTKREALPEEAAACTKDVVWYDDVFPTQKQVTHEQSSRRTA